MLSETAWLVGSSWKRVPAGEGGVTSHLSRCALDIPFLEEEQTSSYVPKSVEATLEEVAVVVAHLRGTAPGQKNIGTRADNKRQKTRVKHTWRHADAFRGTRLTGRSFSRRAGCR
ncbi:hypothetical protein EYF80_025522 [Liparis tanakae]|uniref:Uncharacterized protein n=1 Tax=Liparis tanakae TaxID=230148 RepID=A0A4Z2HF91_9TELE|nr:hypothetical protein EYF80_025522 [Liparis tanakae]